MLRTALLARGQAAAETAMADTCTIRRVTALVTDKLTGAVTPSTTVLYTGKCRVQQHQALARPHDPGEDHLLMLHVEVQLPMSVTGLRVADEITVTASANDQDLVGRTLLIHDLAHKSEATARRVQCVERTGS